MSAPTARSVAASVLVRVLEDAAFASAVLDAEVSRAVQLEARDRALATELVYGSLRVLPWLEERLARHAPRGLGSLDPRTRAELVLSAYQLFFLERVPAFAAVNEAVESIKLARGAKLANFANAVLRKTSAEASAEKGKGPALLLEAVRRSLPPWLDASLRRALGDDGAEALWATGATPPPLGLRVREASSRDACLEALAAGVPGGTFARGAVSPLAILARGGGKSEAWPGSGVSWGVQEEGSQVVALALGARPGERVLDACAGRGNKAALLASCVAGGGGAVDAADLHPSKLARLGKQLGSAAGATFAVDWSVGVGDVPEGYDRVLVDAPCSGVGTLRRRPDLALRREPTDLARLASLQAEVLVRAASRVRDGGRVVYAVCSVLVEEGEEVVARALAADPRLARAPFEGEVARGLAGDAAQLRLLPHVHGTDGYFLASFARRGA